jgi:hypothetical protein
MALLVGTKLVKLTGVLNGVELDSRCAHWPTPDQPSF